MGNCMRVRECIANCCLVHGTYPMVIRHGNKVGTAEAEHIRRISRASISGSATSASSNRSQSRRNSINSWISEMGGSSALLAVPPREGRRVSIASDDFIERMVYDANQPTNTCAKPPV